MTLEEAICELRQLGLSCPSAISVLFLYEKQGAVYQKDKNFALKFNTLIEIQNKIDTMHRHLN